MPRIKKLEIVEKLFKPDENGISGWITVEQIIEAGLPWTGNGNGRLGIFFGVKKYIWEKQGNNKTEALRTTGLSDDFLYGAARPINKEIIIHYRKIKCVVCGSGSNLVVDHKNDLYNDPRVLSADTQTLDDFQSLCNHCNLQKRQIAKKTRETGLRIGATHIPQMAVWGIDFISGDESFDPNDINAMVGTYWHDPVAFMNEIRKRM